MKLVSLMPGPIHLLDGAGRPFLLCPTPLPERPSAFYRRLGTVAGVGVFDADSRGRLPATTRGVLLVVPGAVRAAHPSRMDIVSPVGPIEGIAARSGIPGLLGNPCLDVWLRYNGVDEGG